jgi:hypothetical protein
MAGEEKIMEVASALQTTWRSFSKLAARGKGLQHQSLGHQLDF